MLLRRARARVCGAGRSLMAYDVVSESVRDGPKGYVVIGRQWLPALHQRMVQHVSLAQCALSYDGLYEVVSGTDCTALYLDIEVGCLRAGEGGLLSLDLLRLVSGDAEFWWAQYMTWYLSIASRRWSTEEYECAQGLLVSYLRDFFVECEGWHKGGKPYFLPLGINGIVHNARGTAVLRDAIDTFPAVQLRRNDILNGKDIWAAVCSNAPLPSRTATGERGGNNLVAWVKKLLLGYGLEFLWKEAVASRPRRGGSSPPRSRRRSAPTPRGTMHCTTQGWRETLGVMQFIACSQSKPLTFSGFTEDDRNALAEVDRLIEAPVDTPDVELEPEDEPR
eukprot:400443_1